MVCDDRGINRVGAGATRHVSLQEGFLPTVCHQSQSSVHIRQPPSEGGSGQRVAPHLVTLKHLQFDPDRLRDVMAFVCESKQETSHMELALHQGKMKVHLPTHLSIISPQDQLTFRG